MGALVASLVIGQFATAPVSAVGEAPEPVPVDARIVGGRPIAPARAPWQVALVSSNASAARDDAYADQFCAGSLIASQWVLTAAHCVFDANDRALAPADLEAMVGVGVLSEASSADRIGVERIEVHPDWIGGRSLDGDIALLRLSRTVTPDGTSVDFAAVPAASSGGTWPERGQELLVAGWGCRSVLANGAECPPGGDGYYADALHAVEVADLTGPSSRDCGRAGDFDPTTMVCAGVLAGGIDSCIGDSGGALVDERRTPVVAGIVSFGEGCALAGYPGVYTRVTAYAEWITQISGVATVDVSTIAERSTVVPLTPVRLLDTRTGVGAPIGRIGTLDGSGPPVEVVVAGRAGLPDSGLGAVALNVTVVDGLAPEAGGYVTVYACGSRPDASNLNFVSGQTVPNAVIAPVSASGSVCLYVYGSAHLLVDVSGYLPSGFVPVTPARILDTRSGVGATTGRVGAIDGSGAPVVLTVAGRGGVPSAGADAVALNVTVVDGATNDFGGYVTAYPCSTRPDVSNLNFVSGQTVPNSLIAPLSDDGTVCLYVYGSAHLLADVSGYTVAGFEPVAPVRILDTRSGIGATPGRVGALDGSGSAVTLSVTDRGGVPAGGVAAVALNVTVVAGLAPQVGGYVTVYPCGSRPDASNLNFVTGQTVPNSVIAPVSPEGTICLYSYGTAHLLADVSGYFED